MEIQPVYYLRNWDQAPLELAQALGSTPLPVVVMAHEVQLSLRTPELLSCFQKGQLQMISADVDDQRSDLSWLLDQAVRKGWTHIIAISDWHPSVIDKAVTYAKLIAKEPLHFFFFVEDSRTDVDKVSFVQRLLDVDGLDYRKLKTKTGIFPTFHIKNLKLGKEDQLDFDRVLVYAIRNKCEYKVISVEKGDSAEDQSSVNSWKASIYSWWLLALSSLHSSHSPLHSAVSFGLGAFLACTPFYGLQTGLIILFCFIFRLSFPIAFLGSQISIPPIYSLIVPLQIYVGFFLTGKEVHLDGSWLELAREHFPVWLLGSAVVGGMIAFFMGLTWYLFQSRLKVNKMN